jgi:hypothetical protein
MAAGISENKSDARKKPRFPGVFLQKQAIDQVPTPVFDLPQPVPLFV